MVSLIYWWKNKILTASGSGVASWNNRYILYLVSSLLQYVLGVHWRVLFSLRKEVKLVIMQRLLGAKKADNNENSFYEDIHSLGHLRS